MKVSLSYRQYGLHRTVKECEVPGEFSDYARLRTDPGSRGDYEIDENKLAKALPEGFLPVPKKQVLLTISGESGGTGQRNLKAFRDWAKYFHVYVLNLHLPESEFKFN